MTESQADYDPFYQAFDSPAMRRFRSAAYGEDIGQHSWTSADELRGDIERLRLTADSHLIDLGCGACGPLTFLMAQTGCAGTGVELSPAALRIGQARAEALGVASRLSVQEADLNDPLPFPARTFDAALCIDMVLHLRDRAPFFREVARVLEPGGRFLLADASLLTGPTSTDEVRRRSHHGNTYFVPPGWNETLLSAAGLHLIATEDRTASALRNARGRLNALRAQRAELEAVSGAEAFQRQREYLETVIELCRRQAVSRIVYLTEVPAAG